MLALAVAKDFFGCTNPFAFILQNVFLVDVGWDYDMSYLQTYQRVKAHREGAKPPLDTNQSINPASANQIAESTIIDQSNAVQVSNIN